MSFKSKVDVKLFIKRAKAETRKLIIQGLKDSAPGLEATGKAEVPVDEGDLQRSIKTEVDEQDIDLNLIAGGKGARHVNLVVYGTFQQAPNDFMTRTAQKEEGNVFRNLEKNLGRPL